MRNELEIDVKLLSEMETNIDKNENKLNKVSLKLSKYLKKTSNCCLFVIILVEIVLFILLVTLI